MKKIIIPSVIIILITINLIQYFNNQRSEKVISSKGSTSEVVKDTNKLETKMLNAVFANDSLKYDEVSLEMMNQGQYRELFYYSFIMFMEYGNIDAALHMQLILNLTRNRFKSDKIILFQKYLIAYSYEKGSNVNHLENFIMDDSGKIQTSGYFLMELRDNSNPPNTHQKEK